MCPASRFQLSVSFNCSSPNLSSTRCRLEPRTGLFPGGLTQSPFRPPSPFFPRPIYPWIQTRPLFVEDLLLSACAEPFRLTGLVFSQRTALSLGLQAIVCVSCSCSRGLRHPVYPQFPQAKDTVFRGTIRPTLQSNYSSFQSYCIFYSALSHRVWKPFSVVDTCRAAWANISAVSSAFLGQPENMFAFGDHALFPPPSASVNFRH